MELELADITSKITAFDQNFSNLELIDQKINERVSKLEARMQVAEENPKITNIEQNLSNLKINDDLAIKRLSKLEQQVEGEIRTMKGEIKTLKSGIEKESKNRLQLANKIWEDAKMTSKITTIEQNLSNLKINEDLATKRLTKLEQQVEEEIRTMTRDIKTQSKNHSSVLSIFLTFSNTFANCANEFDIQRNAHIWNKFLYEKEIYKLVPNHSALKF